MKKKATQAILKKRRLCKRIKKKIIILLYILCVFMCDETYVSFKKGKESGASEKLLRISLSGV